MEGIDKKQFLWCLIQMLILLLGTLLTGSRGVWVLLVATFFFLIIKRKPLRVPLTVMLLMSLCIGTLYAAVSGSYQNIGRFLTLSFQSSTFLGRLLYWKDGLQMLVSKPFGSGYMGYSYLQSSMQTGVYTTLFVHNSFLQVFLDAGIVSGSLFLLAFGKVLFSKRPGAFQKWLLLMLFLHFFIDFDMQYISIDFLLFLLFPWEEHKTVEIAVQFKRKKYFFYLTAGAASIMLLYFAAALFLSYLGKEEASLAMYPGQTDILESRLKKSKDMEEAIGLADQILSLNQHIAAAYDAKALIAALHEDYNTMIKYKEKAVENGKYNLIEYIDYLNLLKRSLMYYVKNGDRDGYERSRKIMKEMPERLEQIKQQTGQLGWKIKDRPELELSDEVLSELDRL